MSEDQKLMSAKLDFFHSCFLTHSFDSFGNVFRVPSESASQGAMSSGVMNFDNAATTEFDYFRLGLAQLGRIGVIAWGVEIM